MFLVTLRFVAGLAIGGAAALLWSSRRRAEAPGLSDRARQVPDDGATTTDPRRLDRHTRQYVSHYRHDVDGRVADNALIDGAVEDTFPASDPPAFMQSVVAGTPSHQESEAIVRRQGRKRTGEDAFAE